jgi:phage gpG-like protein
MIIRFDDGGVANVLRDMLDRLGDLSPLTRQWAETLRDGVEEAFDTEGYGKWPDLSEITKRRRAELGYTGKILQQRGELAASIEAYNDASSATVGTAKIYAPVQNFGATIKPKNARRLVFSGGAGETIFAKSVTIPARKFMPESSDDIDADEIVAATKKYLFSP